MPGATSKRSLIPTKPRRAKRQRTNAFIRRTSSKEHEDAIAIDELPPEVLVHIARQLPDLASVLRMSLCAPHLFAVLVADGLDRQVRERLIGGDDCPCLAVAPRLKDESRAPCYERDCADKHRCEKAVNHRIAVALRSERFLEGMSASYASLRDRAMQRMDGHCDRDHVFTEDMLGSVESSDANMDYLVGAIVSHGIEALALRAFALHLRFQELRRYVNRILHATFPLPCLPRFAWNYLPWTACQAQEEFIYGHDAGWLRQAFPQGRRVTETDRVESMLGMARTLRRVIIEHNTEDNTAPVPHFHDDRHCAFNRASSPACRSTDSFSIHMRYQARVLRDVLERVRLRITIKPPSRRANPSCEDIIHVITAEDRKKREGVMPAWRLVADPAMCDVDFVDDFVLLDSLCPTPRVPDLTSVASNSFAYHLVTACLSDSDALFRCGEHGDVLADHGSSRDSVQAAVASLLDICEAPTNTRIQLLSSAICVVENAGLTQYAKLASEAIVRAVFDSRALTKPYGLQLLLTADNWGYYDDGPILSTKLVPMHRALSVDYDGVIAMCVNAASLLHVLRRLQPEGYAIDLGICLANAKPQFEDVCTNANQKTARVAKEILLLPLVALARHGALSAHTDIKSTRATLKALDDMGFRGAKELSKIVS